MLHKCCHHDLIRVAIYRNCAHYATLSNVNHRSLLKCCKISSSDIHWSITIHVLSYINDTQSKSVLMRMYLTSKCPQHLQTVIAIFNSIAEPDAFLTNTMMTCYLNHREFNRAISLFEQPNISVDDVSRILYLKACINGNQYDKGKLHIETLVDNSKEHSIELLNTALDFYGHFGKIKEALRVFKSVSDDARSTVFVNTMMKCFVKNHDSQKAIDLYETVQAEPDDVSRILYLKACTNTNSHDRGNMLIERCGHNVGINEWSIQLLTTVIDFYGHFHEIDKALQLFSSLRQHRKDAISIGAMMKCYINNDQDVNAMSLFEELQQKKQVKMNDVLRMLYLKACMKSKQYIKGKTVISRLVHDSPSIEFITTVIDFYGAIGDIELAYKLFERIPNHRKSTVCINAMLKCYVQNNQSLQAIALYDRFNDTPNSLDDVSNILYLKACTNTDNYDKGLLVINACQQSLDSNRLSIELLTSIIEFYGHFEAVGSALTIFQSIDRNKASAACLNSMMKCYINNHQSQDAIDLFEATDLELDDVSNIFYLKACIDMDYYQKGKLLIEQCLHNVEQRDLELLHTVIDFYGHYGEVDCARNVFDRIPSSRRTIVTINALMNVCNAKQEWNQALLLFSQIPCNQRDAYCYNIALNACGGAVSPANGKNIISELYEPENSRILQDCNIQAAMIRYYAKTRQSKLAMDMFETMDADILQRDAAGVIYQAILDCYGKMGCTQKLLHLFDKIKKESRIKISDQMYSIVLNGCSHSGLLDEAICIFEEMQKRRMQINGQVLTAMIDCLGRKNELNRAENLYAEYKERLVLKSKFSALFSLLSACRTHNDLARAKRVFQEIQNEFVIHAHSNASIDEEIASAYALMGNIYAQNGEFHKMEQLRMELKKR